MIPSKETIDKYKKYMRKRVLVTWVDIITSGGWVVVANDEQLPSFCESFGYLIQLNSTKELGDYIVLSATRSTSHSSTEHNQHISIPVGVIRKISLL